MTPEDGHHEDELTVWIDETVSGVDPGTLRLVVSVIAFIALAALAVFVARDGHAGEPIHALYQAEDGTELLLDELTLRQDTAYTKGKKLMFACVRKPGEQTTWNRIPLNGFKSRPIDSVRQALLLGVREVLLPAALRGKRFTVTGEFREWECET